MPIEIKVRDFLSRLKLSMELCFEGYDVIIGSQDALVSNLNNLPKGIYFEKAISKEKIKFFEILKSKGHLLVSLDEEGLCSLFNYERYITQRVCDETLHLADKVFTWGNSESDLIKDRYPDFREKIKVTGNPRIDMLLSPQKSYHQTLADDYKERYGPYFLFPSSFTVNHAMGNENVDKFLIKMGRVEKEEDLLAYHKKNEYFKKTFFEYSELVEKVAFKFKNVNVIIRPHPAEDATHWNNLSKKYKNLVVQGKGDIASWIIGSEAVVHSSCTTGMEAFILDTPVLSFLPYTDHEYSTQISNYVSKVSSNSNGILDSLNQVLQKKEFANYSRIDNKKFLQNHIANLEGPNSWELIIAELESLDTPHSELENFHLSFFKSFKKNLIRLRQKIFDPKSLVYELQKFDDISIHEISNNISKLQRISVQKKPINVNSIAENLFHLYV